MELAGSEEVDIGADMGAEVDTEVEISPLMVGKVGRVKVGSRTGGIAPRVDGVE